MKRLEQFLLYSRHLFKKHLSRCPCPGIQNPPFTVFSCREGIKLFFNGNELTEKSGFNLSWSCSKGHEDTSSWPVRLRRWNYNEFRLLREDPSNPLRKVEMSFRLASKHLLLYTLKPSFSPEGPFKTCILLNPAYKQWFNETEEKPFPAFKGWITLTPDEASTASSGAGSSLPFSGLPPLLLHQHDSKGYAENADLSTRARVLCAEKKHVSPFLRGYICLFPDSTPFLGWKFTRRKRTLLKQKLLN